MENSIIPLYYLCSIAGFIMVVGGIWLIYKQKIYIDRESKQVTEIETPIGKFKTNIPALVLFALGFVPLIYPIVKMSEFTKEITKEVKIVGNVKSSVHPVQVYAVLQMDSLIQDRDFSLWVPSSFSEYRIIYITGNSVSEDLVDLQKKKSGEIRLNDKDFSAEGLDTFEPNVKSAPTDFQ
jgi:hypothetical protein